VTRIDVGLVLRHSANLPYANLVTRHTGAAVRRCIEVELAALHDGDIALLDFSHIGMMDYSCADEIIAKLLQAHLNPNAPSAYVVFHGITDAHLEAIEDVLLHHGLALVVHFADGAARLVGSVSDDERSVWDHQNSRTPPAAITWKCVSCSIRSSAAVCSAPTATRTPRSKLPERGVQPAIAGLAVHCDEKRGRRTRPAGEALFVRREAADGQ
jgi:hypothetical protein